MPAANHSRGLLILMLTAVVGLSVSSRQARGHAAGENYVWVNVEADHILGRFEIRLSDLKEKLNVDLSVYPTVEEGIKATADKVQEYLLEHFQIVIDGVPVELLFDDSKLFEENAKYAQYFYRTSSGTTIPDKFTIVNDILISDDDPLHRSLIVLEYNKRLDQQYGGENAIMVFGPHKREQELDLLNLPTLLWPREFLWQGILHIWIGIDHILFLLALLLMSVMVKEDGQWKPVPTFRRAFWNVLKIVTLFTIAHSITLSLAALNLINVNSQVVESLIALSIVLVGINNIFPKFDDKTWLVIFFFGLFHGMGFASVMGELPFRTIRLTKVLFWFNVGVEVGQLAIVAIIFPIIFALRKTIFYRPAVVVCGSIVICAVASYWFVERAFGLSG